MAAHTSTTAPETRRGAFATTHWSVILSAACDNQPDSLQALETLCRSYWKPLYAYLRRSGYFEANAEDLTQGFFEHLIRSDLLKKVRMEGGKFRSFMLVSLKNFVSSQRERNQALKRGGGQSFIPVDGCEAALPGPDEAPDAAFDRAWATSVLEEALQLLKAEHECGGRGAIMNELLIFLPGEKVSLTYTEVAARLGTSEGAVKMMVQRMRRRYRECLHLVVQRTVATPEQVEEELRHLVQALG